MDSGIPERDWKAFKIIQRRAQERACDALLAEVSRLLEDRCRGSVERFRAIRRVVDDGARAFNRGLTDHRRSTAIEVLVVMDARGLLTDQDLNELSEETQELLIRWRSLRQ